MVQNWKNQKKKKSTASTSGDSFLPVDYDAPDLLMDYLNGKYYDSSVTNLE
jgi:hypothetical protein